MKKDLFFAGHSIIRKVNDVVKKGVNHITL